MDTNEKRDIHIGIGVTTTSNRAAHLTLWLKKLQQNTSNYYLHIVKDVKNIAQAKNECLTSLKDCDYIFLFDDDCFPVKSGWVKYFINSGHKHLLYLKPFHGEHAQDNVVRYYQNCGGVFMMITKEVFEKVGYFNPAYDKYGFEHAGYSQRIHKAGLTKYAYPCAKETSSYLHSLDYDGSAGYDIIHKPSLTNKEVIESTEINRKIFVEECNSNKIYYNFA